LIGQKLARLDAANSRVSAHLAAQAKQSHSPWHTASQHATHVQQYISGTVLPLRVRP
jgi:hypothetical protein